MVPVFHSDRFVPTLPEGHRFPIDKYGLIREQLLYEGTLAVEQLTESDPVIEEAILAVHQRQYWERLRDLKLSDREMRRTGFPASPELIDRSRRSCQGTFSAALSALSGGIGMNIAGGTHHAYADHGEGFCLLNDIAISAEYLLKTQGVRQILIVDLDVHQGNGNAFLFQGRSEVFTFSMHGKHNYPLHKEQSDLDIGLENEMGDERYLEILKETLPRLIEAVKPDMIYYQAGVDVLKTDKLGKLALSRLACRERDRMVLKICNQHQIPVAVSIGGGYSARILDTVEAHANTFRMAMDIYG